MSNRWSNTQDFFLGGHRNEINYLQVQHATDETLACNKEEVCAGRRMFDCPATYWKAGTTGPVHVIHVVYILTHISDCSQVIFRP